MLHETAMIAKMMRPYQFYAAGGPDRSALTPSSHPFVQIPRFWHSDAFEPNHWADLLQPIDLKR
jgi:hypothetical protein